LIAGSRTEPAMFSEIFDRRHRELHRYLRSPVGAGLAADLAADTFVTAVARRDAYRPQSPDARPWLYGIAHNLLRNHRRHERRQLVAPSPGMFRRAWFLPVTGRMARQAGTFSAGPDVVRSRHE
jgi:DNA-directed RNA polymerase specialized sigma24 family protein